MSEESFGVGVLSSSFALDVNPLSGLWLAKISPVCRMSCYLNVYYTADLPFHVIPFENSWVLFSEFLEIYKKKTFTPMT